VWQEVEHEHEVRMYHARVMGVDPAKVAATLIPKPFTLYP